jgi:predicted DCC family thiol-disulfide oxidoreductase YuxK
MAREEKAGIVKAEREFAGKTSAGEHPVVLFDGVCNLCSATVRFIIERDPAGAFRFASLQSAAAADLLGAHGREVGSGESASADPASVLLVEGGKVYERSTAVLRIARKLQGPARFLWLFLAVPRPIRDVVYAFVARHRYRWFGRTDACLVPTPELRARFLDDAPRAV